MNDAIKFINEKFEEFEADRGKKDQKIINICLNVRLGKVDRALDCEEQYSRREEQYSRREEQYSRRNCLVIHVSTKKTNKIPMRLLLIP